MAVFLAGSPVWGVVLANPRLCLLLISSWPSHVRENHPISMGCWTQGGEW